MYLNKPNPKLCKYKNTTYFPSIQIFTAKIVGWVLYRSLIPTGTSGT